MPTLGCEIASKLKEFFELDDYGMEFFFDDHTENGVT
jgi:hypothetical protein